MCWKSFYNLSLNHDFPFLLNLLINNQIYHQPRKLFYLFFVVYNNLFIKNVIQNVFRSRKILRYYLDKKRNSLPINSIPLFISGFFLEHEKRTTCPESKNICLKVLSIRWQYCKLYQRQINSNKIAELINKSQIRIIIFY